MSDVDGFVVVSCVIATSISLLWIFPRIVKYLWEVVVLSSVSRDQFPSLPLPPGSLGYPLIGESLDFISKGSRFYKQKLQRYGRIYRTHLLGRPTVRVVGQEFVQKILLGENTIVTHNWPTSARILLGIGTVTQSTGGRHAFLRKTMMHAFNADNMTLYIPAMQDIVRTMLTSWGEKGDILTYRETKGIAFRIAAMILLGVNIDNEEDGFSTLFIDVLNNIMTLPFDIPGFGFHKGMNARRQLLVKIKKVLEERKLTSLPFTPVMHFLTAADAECEDKFDEAIDLMFAGHETTASAMTNVTMFLGQNKGAAKRILEELKGHGILNADGRICSDVTYEDLRDLKFTSCVLKETLRLCPPAGGGFRRALKDFELGGYLIPENWTVIYSIRETQHTSPIFTEPETFNPARWEDLDDKSHELGTNQQRFHYIPFGAGQRSCVGRIFAEIMVKLFTIELVSRYDWTLLNDDIQMNYIPVPVSSDHLPISVKARTHAQ